MVLCQPDGVLRCCSSSFRWPKNRSGVARRGAQRDRGPLQTRDLSAEEPLRARVRRRAAAGRGRTFRSSSVAGLAERMFPRVRASPMLLDREMREPLGADRRCSRIAPERAMPARLAAGLADRTAVAVVSANRDRRSRPRVPTFTRSTSCARSPPIPKPQDSGGAAGREGDAGLASGAGTARRRHRQSRARPFGAPPAPAVEPRARSAATRTISAD